MILIVRNHWRDFLVFGNDRGDRMVRVMTYRWSYGLLVFLFLTLTGCVTTSPEIVTDLPPIFSHVWPKPPDLPRILAEISLRSLNDLAPEKSSSVFEKATGIEQTQSVLQKPVNVAAYKGRIYVADSTAGMVQVFDIPKRRVFSIGYRLEGKLLKPHGMAIGSNGHLFVADMRGRRVVEYDALGLFVQAIGNEQMLLRPSGVAISPDGERIYVVDNGGVDSDQHYLLIFNAQGGMLDRIGQRGMTPGAFNLPTDVVVAPDGTVYVLDAGNFRIQAFDPTGLFLRTWGGVGRGLGQFSRPKGLAVDGQGHVYVSDSSFSNIQIFNADGQLLMSFGDRGLEGGLGRFVLPAGVATDETGRIYVVDQYHKKVDVFRMLSEPEGDALLKESLVSH